MDKFIDKSTVFVADENRSKSKLEIELYFCRLKFFFHEFILTEIDKEKIRFFNLNNLINFIPS